MTFLRRFLINLLFLGAIGILLYLISPEMVGGMIEVYGALFGPMAILFLIVGALPRRRRSSR